MLGATGSGDDSGRSRLASLPEEEISWIDALVAWELDRGTGSNPDVTSRLVRELVLSNREQTDMVSMLEIRASLLANWASAGVASRKRLAARDCFERALGLVRTENTELAARIEFDLDQLRLTGIAPDPWIGGDDLVAVGLRPGPFFRTVLDQVYDAQLEGRLSDREVALALAIEIATGISGDPRG